MLYHLFTYLDKEYNLPGAGLFQFLTFRAGLAVLISFLIALVFGKKIIRWIETRQMIEKQRVLGLPNENDANRKKVPTMGGIIIHLAILVPCLLLADLRNVYIQLLILSTIMMGAVGFLDDYLKLTKGKDGLAGRYKIMGQVLLGIIVGLVMFMSDKVVVRVSKDYVEKYKYEVVDTVQVEHNGKQKWAEEMYYVKTSITNVPFFKGNEFDYAKVLSFLGDNAQKFAWIVFIPFFIFIITAVSNAANLTDGIDGLAAGTSAIIGAALGLLAYVSGNTILADYLNILYIPYTGEVMVFTACFWAACIGFLWYNTHPAQIYMGDTGSLALGSIIAVLAIIIRKELLIPLLCAVFLVETLSVVIQTTVFKYRKRKYGLEYAQKNRVFLMTPIHHHFQKLGYHDAKIVSRFWIVGIMLAIITVMTLKLR
jgi:phospho-N-acetylmuramoyl-pentapeptide-transferase